MLLMSVLALAGCGAAALRNEDQVLRLSCGQGQATALFSRACRVDADCAIAQHQLDCCGSMQATGIARTELATFQAYEETCVQKQAPCNCVAKPVQVDDGTFQRGVDERVALSCLEGQCFTSLK